MLLGITRRVEASPIDIPPAEAGGFSVLRSGLRLEQAGHRRAV